MHSRGANGANRVPCGCVWWRGAPGNGADIGQSVVERMA